MIGMVDIIGDLTPAIDIVDVGAMWMGAEAVAYKGLVNAGLARVVGFEPAPGECEKLNALGLAHQKFLPYFIGDGQPRRFHLTSRPMTSSLYEPDPDVLSRFPLLEELTFTERVMDVHTRRLDDVPEITNIDYIKIDVQGAELDVLRGGTRALSSAVVVQTEVEFVPMYKGQPLYADIDEALRAMGFLLHSFPGIAKIALKPFQYPEHAPRPLRQHLWADALYVRDFRRFHELSPAQLLKTATIMHHVYDGFDVAAHALAHYDAKAGTQFWRAYLLRLAPPGAELPEPRL